MKKAIKIAMIGAGSVSFCPATVSDILTSDALNTLDLTVALMDIDEKALKVSTEFCKKAKEIKKRDVKIISTLSLDEAVENADFVITAIEKERYLYWSQDFHIPRKYGFRQIYGENGGPGGMFHTLRNATPILEIVHAMERLCPDAYLLNYTNPEAKLVEFVSRESKIKVVGLCHGEQMGVDQLVQILEIPKEDLDTEISGLNHFGWFTKIKNKKTGEDLYPLLRRKEKEMDPLAHWDELALSRTMFKTYGLWPYPGANHIGEYICWSDNFLASASIQYYYDPLTNKPWEGGDLPEFIYSFSSNPTKRPLFKKDKASGYEEIFDIKDGKLPASHEYGVPIIEAIALNKEIKIGAVNVLNNGYINGITDMVVEVPAIVDGTGIHPQKTGELPTAVASMVNLQGSIHKVIYEAFKEKSKHKLLQAILLDPTISSYYNAIAMIDEMCELQKDILPKLTW